MTATQTAPPPTPSGGDRRSNRAMLKRAASAQASAEELAAVVASARAEVSAAFEAVRERQVQAAVEKMSIESIKDVSGSRARLDGLPAHGVFTVADVLRAGPERLAAVPGIGEGTARKVVGAADQLRQAARDSLQFRISYDPDDADSTRLLQALAVWGAVRHAAEAHEEDAAEVAEQLAAERPVARVGPVRRLFLGPRRRRAADQALQRVAALVDRAEASGLLQAAHDVRSVARPSPAEVWRDFEQRSAVYYGLLGHVVPLGGDVAAAEGFLPADIVERVNAQRLDTSRLNEQLRLRGYQSFGARFALVQRRVVLGDEMGLGKTVQAIATMAHLAANGATHFLVVCPASVLINWTREVAPHSTLPVVALHGPDRARRRAAGGVAAASRSPRSARSARSTRTPPRPALLVVDEAHYVKNPDTKRSRAVSRIAAGAERVLFLTGTPMENRVDEFKALVDHLQPDIAASIDRSTARWGSRRSGARRAGLPSPQPAGRADRAARAGAGRRVGGVRPRRRRRLPGGGARRQLHGDAPGRVRGPPTRAFGQAGPAAGDRPGGDGQRPQGGGLLLLPRRARHRVAAARPRARAADRIDVARRTAAHGGRLLRPGRAGGAGSQIKAGGVGLNMQAASVVILCEPQVKPSTEAQAVARAHRMGQIRSVQVHRLLIEDSVDQRMLELLDSKARLFDEYARHSDIAEAAPGAVDVSEVQLARLIVAQEQQRLGASDHVSRLGVR